MKWYEEPGDPLDFDLLGEVAEASGTPRRDRGESLLAARTPRNLVRYGGIDPNRDLLQMDPALCYGLVEYLRILEMLKEHGWSPRRCVPHGGHQFALHIAAGLGLGGNESYPGVFQPFGGFADERPGRGRPGAGSRRPPGSASRRRRACGRCTSGCWDRGMSGMRAATERRPRALMTGFRPWLRCGLARGRAVRLPIA